MDVTSLFDISKQIVEKYKQNLLQAGMSQNGALYNFTWTVDFNGELFQLKFNLPKEWYFVEHGRNPSAKMPPVNAIMQWVEAKRLMPRGKNGKVPTTKQIAFAIAKKIQKEGFYSPNHQGKHPLQKTMQQSDKYIEELCAAMTAILNKEVQAEIGDLFTGLDCFNK